MEKYIELLNALDDELVGRKVSIDEITKTYARFIIFLLQNEEISDIANHHRDWILITLDSAIEILEKQITLDQRANIKTELSQREKAAIATEPRLAYLYRCLINCFFSERDWNPDTAQYPTPLFPYFLALNKVAPNIEGNFDKFFRNDLSI